jgi:hypothetical protein
MSAASPLATLAVGVLVERSKGSTQWADFYWRPAGVLAGVPDTPPWTRLSDDGERVGFYAGATDIELYRSEAAHYRANLQSGTPQLWVVLRPAEADPPYELALVTADPAEGEGMTESGTYLVEAVPMPEPIQDAIAGFVAEHYVEEVFVKRKRDRADPDALARRRPLRENPK